ncbi:beta-hydroxyacyl-ACP dehydratase, partial [bacterium]|nr:beta-hydroxyacyl-ACP dehydratase [bacterium]
MEYEKILKGFRKKAIATLETLPESLVYSQTHIKKLIPHRDPFLLLDQLIGLDLEQGIILGSRIVSAQDPVFQGHFPDLPVYPGSLQLEMIGQLGLCLYHFLTHRSSVVQENATPIQVRATKILGAHFLEPIGPDKEVQVIAKKLEHETYFGTVVGQVLCAG